MITYGILNKDSDFKTTIWYFDAKTAQKVSNIVKSGSDLKYWTINFIRPTKEALRIKNQQIIIYTSNDYSVKLYSILKSLNIDCVDCSSKLMKM